MFKYKSQFRDDALAVLEDNWKPRERRDCFSLIGIESRTGRGVGGSDFFNNQVGKKF